MAIEAVPLVAAGTVTAVGVADIVKFGSAVTFRYGVGRILRTVNSSASGRRFSQAMSPNHACRERNVEFALGPEKPKPDAELRLVYGQPITDRQVIQLRLERNSALGQPTWTLPRVEVTKAKSTRGHIAVSADAGFRLTPDRTVA